jgi:hypothetical protein
MNPDSIGGPDSESVMSAQVVVHLPALELPKSRLSVCKDIVKYATGQLSNGDDAGNGHLPGSPIVSDTGFEIATTKLGNGWMANVASA